MLSPLLVSLPLSAVIFASYESYLRWVKVDTTHGVPIMHCIAIFRLMNIKASSVECSPVLCNHLSSVLLM